MNKDDLVIITLPFGILSTKPEIRAIQIERIISIEQAESIFRHVNLIAMERKLKAVDDLENIETDNSDLIESVRRLNRLQRLAKKVFRI